MQAGSSIRAAGPVNALFLVAAAVGFVATTRATPGVYDEWTAVPTLTVLVYALLVRHLTASCEDRPYAEHAIDLIYYLGFLFTLFALVILFSSLGAAAAGADLLSTALTYIGISVTTSLAGVLGRSMVRGSYLRRHPERSADTIEAFLAERAATVEALAGREQAYLDALDRYIQATSAFAGGLGDLQERLGAPVELVAAQVRRQVQSLDELEAVQQRLIQTAEAIHRESSIIPWSEVGAQMDSFRTGVSELNAVIDGLVEVLESKVERIQ